MYDNYISQGVDKISELLIEPNIKKAELLKEGTIIVNLEQIELNKCIYFASEARYKHYRVWISTTTQGQLRSELGNLLANKLFEDGGRPDFAVIYQYNFKNNEWWISLRGLPTGPNLTTIAKELDERGGGHRNASGATLRNRHITDYFISV